MAAECAGVDYTYVSVNPMQGETKTPEFLAMNPTHTIPTIKDGIYNCTVQFILYMSDNK